MNKVEILMLRSLIDKLEQALQEYDVMKELEALYDLTTEANALYGSSVDGLSDAFDMLEQYSGTIRRQSGVILALLRREHAIQECSFCAGIMPYTLDHLAICPAAQQVYQSGINKYADGVYERNVLDDMRLALELLVKHLLSNQKSLENQLPELGQALSRYHSELRNLISKTLDYLCKYQNSYIKHNDAVDSAEVGYIIDQTSAVINFLIDAIGNNQ